MREHDVTALTTRDLERARREPLIGTHGLGRATNEQMPAKSQVGATQDPCW